MKRKALGYALVLLVGVGLSIYASKGFSKAHVKMTPLLQEDLGGLDGQEVIVGMLVVTSAVSFPKHYHPGTELGYVLEGSLVLNIEGQPPVVYFRRICPSRYSQFGSSACNLAVTSSSL